MKDTELEQKIEEAWDNWSIPKEAYQAPGWVTSSTGFGFPKIVGFYHIGGNPGLRLHLNHKPNKVHRYFMKLLLGWEWKDNV